MKNKPSSNKEKFTVKVNYRKYISIWVTLFILIILLYSYKVNAFEPLKINISTKQNILRVNDTKLLNVKKDIEEFKNKQPEIFKIVSSIKVRAIELDKYKRGRLAIVTPVITSFGNNIFFPVLFELLYNTKKPDEMTWTAWIAWRVGLLESIGSFRNDKTLPVLKSVLYKSKEEPDIIFAAVQSIGKIATDESVDFLIAYSRQPQINRFKVLAGMGFARRLKMAEYLADLLTKCSDKEEIHIVIKALGKLGNIWAWETPVISKSGEGALSREVAAKAIIKTFTKYSNNSHIKRSAAHALVVIDWTGSIGFIESISKSETSNLKKDLLSLKNRLIKSPLHQ